MMTAKKKILVVEDNALNRSLLCEILRPDYDVVEAENGQKALACGSIRGIFPSSCWISLCQL
ncbi:response regulator [Clostridium sp. D33t1_170424_F3]|uniref:response regulator n=1 Tax=Clostridium sp. D33t1_170424_F3 TaxID=2787099 RepID=UPI0018AA8C94